MGPDKEVVCYQLADGTLIDLADDPPEGAKVIRQKDPSGRQVLRHSTAHVLAQAVLSLWPEAKFAGGPAIENGFYYDFDIGRPFTPEDLERIEARMAEIISEDQPYVRDEVSIEEAVKVFEGQPYKLEWIKDIDEDSAEQGVIGESVSLYRNLDRFVDLCRGPHIPSTGRIKAFKLTRSSGAYWKGSEKNPMLQRIYGTAWESKKALEEYLHRKEEEIRRDHRRIGAELELFSFPSELGAGLAVWHPKGGMMRRTMEEYSRKVHERNGYEFVYSPNLARSVLWETSGHLDFYSENMYPPMEMEGSAYYVKPMNCPFHAMIYKSRTRSYRELPLRLFEFGNVYRLERSGVIHGILRARGFTQDDAHIFVTEDKVVEELRFLLGFVLRLLRDFGFEAFEAKLATRNPEKSVGTDEGWELATDALRKALESEDIGFEVEEGDAVFYGPKIDVYIRDAIGRPWQLSTLQVDFNLPERFDLEYVGEDGARHRPYVIHRALFGSVERFFGILVEHYAGAFPTWLAPTQCLIIPIADRHLEYAQKVDEELRASEVRSEIDASDETLGNRIRKGQATKVPYMVIVGDKEVEAETLSLRPRAGDQRHGVPLKDFVTEISKQIAERGSPEGS